MPVKLAVSIICSNMLNLKRDLFLIEKGGADYIHFDVMDGHFVPRLGLYPEILKSIKKLSKLPVDVHLMVSEPEPYLEIFANAGADIICIHPEACDQLHGAIQSIKKLGIKAGVVLNPTTPLEVLDCILDEIDLITIMAINPGIVGHKLIKSTFGKISDLRKKLNANAKQDIIIAVDGGVTFDSSPELVRHGAEMLICGSSTVFNQVGPIDKMILKLRNIISRKQH